ncbi:hypothetical protein MKX03_008184 [Papaver bracteatum]|nr:hypothetical protein MKX03_008184 [Papaver bracteatum]
MYQQVLLNSRYRSNEEVKGNFSTLSGRYAELIRPTENPSVDLGIVEEEFEDETHPEGEWLDEWMQVSAMEPNFRELEDTDMGRRDIDKNHPWSTVQDTHVSGSTTSLPSLSRQQKATHDLILDSLRSNQLLGKSTLINAIIRSTRELFSDDNYVRVMAPTSVAVFNMGGSTIHYELGITVDFKNTKLIIIDEYNMIGRKMLTYIDLRLRDIFGTKESFGNICIVISLTLSLNNMFSLNKFSGSLELRSQNIENLCRD